MQNAFKTEVKQQSINGEMQHANSSDPQIPAALASVVKSVIRLHDFQARSFSQGLLVKPCHALPPSPYCFENMLSRNS